LALNRHRLAAALCAAMAALTITAAPASATVFTRVEGPTTTVFQGDVKPATGALKDDRGQTHTTTKVTALGALVTASRTEPFALDLGWSDSFGGAWNGFFVNSIAGIAPPPTAFWAFKIGQKLAFQGLGSTPVNALSRVLVYYTTFDPVTFATEPTLGISGPAQASPGDTVTITVKKFDDAGVGSPAAGARLVVNGTPAVRVDESGHATIHIDGNGDVRVRARKAGEIRSKTLWIDVVPSS
jgi:hypothetical protein